MKAVILAAGMGTRLIKYTENLPKGMLSFRGKPLLLWQIERFREVGINDIVIVTGYQKDKIQFPNIRYYHNERYAETNMVESLMCLGNELVEDDLIVAYSDVIFSKKLLEKVIATKAELVVAADEAWRSYWHKRYGTTETDLESLTVNDQLDIIELGKPITTSQDVIYRYIGLNRFSQSALRAAVTLHQQKKATFAHWLPSNKPFYQGYFTDLINELVQQGVKAKIADTKGDWLEFDTEMDYEMVLALDEREQLAELITL